MILPHEDEHQHFLGSNYVLGAVLGAGRGRRKISLASLLLLLCALRQEAAKMCGQDSLLQVGTRETTLSCFAMSR